MNGDNANKQSEPSDDQLRDARSRSEMLQAERRVADGAQLAKAALVALVIVLVVVAAVKLIKDQTSSQSTKQAEKYYREYQNAYPDLVQ